MRIGIHQPNFLPWMGYFYKMAQCDTFVFLDNVEYTKKSYTKRVKIHKAQDLDRDQYITIPLQKHSDHVLIHKLRISQRQNWHKKVSRKIYETYHNAPYYFQLEPIIELFFTTELEDDSFSAFTIRLLRHISQLLALSPDFIIGSELSLKKKSQNINIDVVNNLKGEIYISGMGAKKYHDESDFIRSDIQLIYSDFQSKFPAFDIPNHFLDKSIISYLAWYDINDLRKLLQSK